MAQRPQTGRSLGAVMKKGLAWVAAIVALIATPALAGSAPQWNWTGANVGIDWGHGWNDSTGSFSCISPAPSPPFPVGAGCPANGYGATGTPHGGVFGGQFGYDFQSGLAVFGVETDIQWSGIKSSSTASFPRTFPTIGGGILGAPSTFNVTQDLDWFGTARFRVGLTPFNRMLIYATGGVMYGRESVSFSDSFPGNPSLYAAGAASTKTGGTIGGGVDYAFAKNVFGSIEGLYYDLGSETVSFFNPRSKFTVKEKYNFQGEIVRVGLDYKFGIPSK
jgi:outer membrane immunogenic protein